MNMNVLQVLIWVIVSMALMGLMAALCQIW